MDESIHDKLNRETAQIDWETLAPFFARGQMWCVRPEADLIEVALGIAEDKVEHIKQWQERGVLFQPDDAQALIWSETKQTLWATVIAPWVIAQPVNNP